MTLKYLPEGALLNLPRNKAFIDSRKGLESAQKLGEILEAVALSCDNDLNLTVRLGEGLVGVIPRREATLPERKGYCRNFKGRQGSLLQGAGLRQKRQPPLRLSLPPGGPGGLS